MAIRFSFRDDPAVPRFDAPQHFTVMDAKCGFCGEMSEAIFPALLGARFHELPPALQELHRGERSTIEVTREGETWTRALGGRRFRSHLSLGTGRDAGLMCERFGIITVVMEIGLEDGRLWFVPRRWRMGRLPLPNALLPKGDSFECVRDASFAFNVRIEAPLLGLIAAYEGTLRPSESA
jgi:hypothetical protein